MGFLYVQEMIFWQTSLTEKKHCYNEIPYNEKCYNEQISPIKRLNYTHIGLSFMSGIGAQVNETVSNRNGLRPHTSDRAPIRGALRKDNIP